MEKEITGKVWKFGDDINTDVIFPGKYTYTLSDPAEMARHAMEDADPGFAEKISPNDIIVAGKNFGCGSSREQAALCLKAAGVGAVVAASFSRIYFRNAINLGLPIVICPEAADLATQGDEMTIYFEKGEIHVRGRVFSFPPLSPEVAEILSSGGLIPYVRKKLGIEKEPV